MFDATFLVYAVIISLQVGMLFGMLVALCLSYIFDP